MGYWEEKRDYEEEAEQKHLKRNFCGVCGRKLTNNNLKGVCVKCGELICSVCGKLYTGKIMCSDCKQGIEHAKLRKKQTKKVLASIVNGISTREGVIPVWLVVLGFFFYIIPGVILLIIRNNQLQGKRRIK